MPRKKIKISELPVVQSFTGLFTIGVDSLNRSVRVGLEFIKTAADNATAAANNANTKATAANSAATAANTAATAATQAASSANSAATAANTAATNASQAANSANTASTSATQAAQSASTAANSVNQAKDAANAAATSANQAATAANQAANSASQAIASANAASTNANTKAGLADSKATDANNAAILANQKAEEANITIIRLEELEASLVGQYKLIPTGLELEYPEVITYRDSKAGRIEYVLTPEDTGRNVLFLGDSNVITVFPDGSFTVNKPGVSTIYVIPTENTAIYKIIKINVVEPALRKIKANSLRVLGNGNLRLT